MTEFKIVRRRNTSGKRTITITSPSGDSYTQASKKLSLAVVEGMLWFVAQHKDDCDPIAPSLILADLFKGTDKAVVQMQLNKLAAQRLLGG